MRPRPRHAPDPELTAFTVARQALRSASLALTAGRLADAASLVRTAGAVARLVQLHPSLDPASAFRPEKVFVPERDVFELLAEWGWTPPADGAGAAPASPLAQGAAGC